MNRQQVAATLAYAATIDNRTFGEETVVAWHSILGDLDFADSQQAVCRHFATSDAYLMPVHIRRGVEEITRERRQGDYAAAAARTLVAAESSMDRRPLRDRSEDLRELIDELRQRLPDGDPDKLRWGHRYWRELQRDARRQAAAEPNPHFAGWTEPSSRQDSHG